MLRWEVDVRCQGRTRHMLQGRLIPGKRPIRGERHARRRDDRFREARVAFVYLDVIREPDLGRVIQEPRRPGDIEVA